MKQKNLVLTTAVYAIVILVYNLLVFTIFKRHTNVFWISYGFALLAFAAQAVSMVLAFKKADVETVFFGLPLASFSVYYLIAELCVGAVFMTFQNVSTALAVVIQVLILAIFTVIAIIAIMARDTVQQISDDVKKKAMQHKALGVDVDMLLAACTNAELKAKLRKLSETVKYSDPMTNDAIADTDARIQQKLDELRIYCENDETADALKACSALELLFVERNRKLMISK